MHRLTLFVCTLLLLAAATPASAALLRYEITTSGFVSLLPVIHDPVADLLGVARGATTNVPVTLRLDVDTDRLPYVENDNSVLQQVTYRDAVTGGAVTVNGVVFATQRTPQPAAGAAPSTGDESEIGFLNRVDPTLFDIVELGLRTSPLGLDLFTRYTVPFGQTFGGTFYADATVDLSFAGVLVQGAGLLDDVALPQATGALEDAASLALSLQLPVTFGGGPQALVSIGGIAGTGSYGFSVTPVPLPPAAVLLGTALGLLGARRRAAGRAR
ncbi:MAG: hypothetical protein RLW62_17920 [Gammaproteobacteria bacterium]